jgi:hypothetical protein
MPTVVHWQGIDAEPHGNLSNQRGSGDTADKTDEERLKDE